MFEFKELPNVEEKRVDQEEILKELSEMSEEVMKIFQAYLIRFNNMGVSKTDSIIHISIETLTFASRIILAASNLINVRSLKLILYILIKSGERCVDSWKKILVNTQTKEKENENQ